MISRTLRISSLSATITPLCSRKSAILVIASKTPGLAPQGGDIIPESWATSLGISRGNLSA
jgi:hypothetical protein